MTSRVPDSGRMEVVERFQDSLKVDILKIFTYFRDRFRTEGTEP